MEDIFDVSDTKNPLAVVEYVQELFTHYRRTEVWLICMFLV